MKNPLHKLSLRTLKLFLRFMRQTKIVFTGVGIAVSTAAVLVGFFVLLWWGAGAVKTAIEFRFEQELVNRILSIPEPKGETPQVYETPAIQQFVRPSAEDLSLVSGSFSDLFSGTGWLDTDRTTMYQDKNATAFLFPPKFELRETASANVEDLSEKETRCIGRRCLSRIGSALTLDGVPVALPEVSGELSSISVGALGTTWVVGEVRKENESYYGELYYFDGGHFASVFSPNGDAGTTPFVSKYPGTFGFGGDANDWIAVYGAYDGMGYQFRQGETPHPLTNLFGIRLMGGGFRPLVFHDADSGAWYVWDASGKGIRFLKLFEDRNGLIVGVTDLSGPLFTSLGADAQTLGAAPRDGKMVLEFGLRGGGVSYRELVDRGFTGGSYTIVSSNLNGRDAAVRRARIGRTVLEAGGTQVSFSLANKEGDWMPVKVGEWLTFPDPEGKSLFWKAEFTGDGSQSTGLSPFFDLIQIEYFLRFPSS